MYTRNLLILTISLLSVFAANAQDNNLLSMLSDSLSAGKQKSYVTGTFKATHVINMQTVEAPAKGVLSFVIQHRFGQLNSGAYNFFGLDNATLRLGFDYGLTDRFSVGIGRSSYLKTFDGYLKYKLLRQMDGTGGMPVSVALLGTISNYTQKIPGKEYLDFSYRSAYTFQALIARKLSGRLSLEIKPTYLHYNLVPTVADKNDLFVISGGGRFKITRRSSINVEYNYLPPNQVLSTDTRNSLSFGYDIETGGHVFQLVFSNSQSMLESQYLAQTTGSWGHGDIYFGFNIARDFSLTKHAKGRISQ